MRKLFDDVKLDILNEYDRGHRAINTLVEHYRNELSSLIESRWAMYDAENEKDQRNERVEQVVKQMEQAVADSVENYQDETQRCKQQPSLAPNEFESRHEKAQRHAIKSFMDAARQIQASDDEITRYKGYLKDAIENELREARAINERNMMLERNHLEREVATQANAYRKHLIGKVLEASRMVSRVELRHEADIMRSAILNDYFSLDMKSFQEYEDNRKILSIKLEQIAREYEAIHEKKLEEKERV